MKLKVLKFKGILFETAIIDKYFRRESSVEDSIKKMYLADLFAVWKILPKLYGKRKYFQKPPVTWTKRHMSI